MPESKLARLEYIHYEFFDVSIGDRDELALTEPVKKPIERLPQIFWEDGRGWDEANVWALERRVSPLDVETTTRTMKHLCRYANFLETHGTDWRHFPLRKDEQVLRKFRKYLLDDVRDDTLANSTASNCMNAVIQFYRFAKLHNLVGHNDSLWSAHRVAIQFYDTVGFERSMLRLTTDLAIPNRKRIGVALEDGLLPLRSEHWSALLAYTAENSTEELHLMLSTGFFTGARVGTITSLTVNCLDTAREDPTTPGIYLLPAGPGTGVATKFSVKSNLLVPEAVLRELKIYASSTSRLLREAKAHRDYKNLLFLARSGRPYTVGTVDRLVYEMRKQAVLAGLYFMKRFIFHQSRATFGTWLMQLLLKHVSPTIAIGVVRDAMFHKHETTTMGYITFLEKTHAKGTFASAFNEAFTGLRNRDWNKVDA